MASERAKGPAPVICLDPLLFRLSAFNPTSMEPVLRVACLLPFALVAFQRGKVRRQRAYSIKDPSSGNSQKARADEREAYECQWLASKDITLLYIN